MCLVESSARDVVVVVVVSSNVVMVREKYEC